MRRISELKKKVAQPGDSPEPDPNQAYNEAIDKLLQRKFTCVDDLWEKIGEKFKTGIDELSKQTSVDKQLLIEILADGAWEPGLTLVDDHYKPETISDEKLAKLRAYWPELLAAVILLLLAALLTANVALKVDTLIVKKELPAFSVLKKDDLEVKQAIGIPGSLTSLSDAEDHYLLQPVTQGARLYGSQISKVSITDGDDRHVFSVPVKAGAISPTLTPPNNVRLLFSSRRNNENNIDGANVICIDDVIVLAVNRQGDSSSIVVAVKGNPLNIARLLGTSDVVVAQQMSR